MRELALPDLLSADPYRVVGLIPFAIAFPTRPLQLSDYFLALVVQVLKDVAVKGITNNRDGQALFPETKQQVNAVSDPKAAESVDVFNDQDRAVGIFAVDELVQSVEVAT